MFKAYDSSFHQVIDAMDASKKESYYCWACEKPLVLKKGRIIQPHFAHQPKENCGDGWSHPSKTKWHQQMQALFNTTEKLMEDKETGERHIADAVYQDIVFEFQHSQITAEEVQSRTAFYNQQGYRVVWVVDVCKQIDKGSIDSIDTGHVLFTWKRPYRMFDKLPFLSQPDQVRVALYWENGGEIDHRKGPQPTDSVGYIGLVTWYYEEYIKSRWDRENECYIELPYENRPDMRFFALSNQHRVNGRDSLILDIFSAIDIEAKKYRRMVEEYLEEREQRAMEFRYYCAY